MSITVYGQPACGKCMAATRTLDNKGIAYDYKDLSLDADASAYAKSLGHFQAPVVVVNEGEDHWSGFRPDKIDELAV